MPERTNTTMDDISKLTYTVPEMAEILGIPLRTAYNFCHETKDFRVIHIGKLLRVHKESFDAWLLK